MFLCYNKILLGRILRMEWFSSLVSLNKICYYTKTKTKLEVQNDKYIYELSFLYFQFTMKF